MKVKNNTDTPQFRLNWKHLFLVVLHIVVLILSASSHDFRVPKLASRALPQALHYDSTKNIDYLILTERL